MENIQRTIKLACDGLIQDAINKYHEDPSRYQEISVSEEQLQKIAGIIVSLPVKYQNALLGRMLFNLSDSEINHSFGMQGAGWCVDRARMIIHEMMGLEPETIIPEKSIQAACEIALERLMKESRFQNAELLAKMKKPRWKTILKRVAIFVAVIISSGIVLLSVSATAREIFLKWVVKVFPEYSSFQILPEDAVGGDGYRIDGKRDDFHCFVAAYIPEEFELEELEIGMSYAQRRYMRGSESAFSIRVSAASSRHNLNTEGVTIAETTINGNKGYTWVRGQSAFVIWEVDGYMINVVGEIEQKIAVKIAESISYDASLLV